SVLCFFFSSRRRHTRFDCDWSSDVCSSDLIFFARYEASQFGSPYIETEHLLLGLLREDKALANRFLRSHAAVDSIRKQIEGHATIREKVSTSVDLPLSHECKRVLAYGAEEAERLNHKHI